MYSHWSVLRRLAETRPGLYRGLGDTSSPSICKGLFCNVLLEVGKERSRLARIPAVDVVGEKGLDVGGDGGRLRFAKTGRGDTHRYELECG